LKSEKYKNKIPLLLSFLLVFLITIFVVKSRKDIIVEKEKKLNIGGIVPHHDTAEAIINSFFQKFKTEDAIDVIILAPNHYEKGINNVLSTKNIYPDLIQDNLAEIDEIVVNFDHSISVPTSFINKYLPNSKIIPLIFKKETTLSSLKKISIILSEHLKNKKTIIICSTDFSHNLFPNEAEKRDEITLQAIKDFDYKKIMTFSSEYIDSPQSLVSLLLVMENLNIKNFRMLDHSNSAKILGPTTTNTTSYFTIIF
jgi:AmmeMemoRadiSam system protein B